MSKENYLYQGNVQIHLQGQHALLPVDSPRRDQVSYFIGSRKSKLLIRDFREEPILAAQRAPAGVEGAEFAVAFNQLAYAEVAILDKGNELEKVEINLRPAEQDEDTPVLWLGVKNDALMPMLDIEWEIMRPISSKKIAFTSLVRFDKKEAPAMNSK
ncbi:MAG TPA: hypothetical protein VK249_23125 [Anaerolineales bacterium]|nr:hypothetical protein [Anaerolineales bacterium]